MIREFALRYPDSANTLSVWFKKAQKANWANFHEVQKDFNSVDAVGNDRYVFNIKGNNYRLVTLIIFSTRTIYLLFIGTHIQYDKIEASTIRIGKK